MEKNPDNSNFKEQELLNDLQLILKALSLKHIEYNIFIRTEKTNNEIGYLNYNFMAKEHTTELVQAFLFMLAKEVFSNNCLCRDCDEVKNKVEEIMEAFIDVICKKSSGE